LHVCPLQYSSRTLPATQFKPGLLCRQTFRSSNQGRIQDFKLGGAHLKNLRRAQGGANIFGIFRVKNHDFTPKNHIFSHCGGRRENFWGISCEKSRFYAKKSYFFQFQGGRAPGAPPPPGSAPGIL
jgi:hypothetical protein